MAALALPEDTCRFCISADRRQPTIYACSSREMFVFNMEGASLHLSDVTALPQSVSEEEESPQQQHSEDLLPFVVLQ